MASCWSCGFPELTHPHWPVITCSPGTPGEDTCPHSYMKEEEGSEEWGLAFLYLWYFLRILLVCFTKNTNWQTAQDWPLSADCFSMDGPLLTLWSTGSSALASYTVHTPHNLLRHHVCLDVRACCYCCLVVKFCPTLLRPIVYSPGEGNGTSLQYSCLENPMDRGAW